MFEGISNWNKYKHLIRCLLFHSQDWYYGMTINYCTKCGHTRVKI